MLLGVWFVLSVYLSVTDVFAVLPFQDPSLPWDKRVDDLVMRLTLDEVANQTLALYGNPSPTAVPRLGIKPYVWITECVRGQVSANTTAFPHSIGLAAGWSKDLMFDMTQAISSEVRAQWNNKRRMGIYKTMFGLSCFSPVINIARHPLWGRNQETYGECPFLSGTLVQGFVKGLQGDNPRYVKVNAGCKHFDVHGGPENIPVSRFSFDAKVSTRDWRMTFLPAFKMCVEAGTYSLMCSYNSINGVPACANGELLTNITRKEWGFQGYVMSDAGAITNIRSQHHYTKSDAETAADSINAGCNLELGSSIFLNQLDALKKGMLREDQLRDNIKPLMYTRMRLGEFDPDSMNPYASIDMSVVQSADHRALAIRAAQMSFTLLKNDMNALPLKGKVDKLAIVGPFGNVTDQLFGDYASNIIPQFTSNVWQSLRQLANHVNFEAGCDDTKCMHYTKASRAQLKMAVDGMDMVIVALGTGQNIESEGNDRSTLALPGHQLGVLKDAVYYAKGAKVIVLLFNAGPLDVTWAKLNPGVHAIMECYFPAQSTGEALYNTLMATSPDAMPAGRLPMTWPAYLEQVPPITDYNMDGHTYRYYNGEPLYPFGYGLSYSKFEYSGLLIQPSTLTKGLTLKISVMVKNVGVYDCDEVVQVYVSWPQNSTVPLPKIQLVSFKRVRLMKNQEMTVNFEVSSDQLSVWVDDKTGFGLLAGKMILYVGGQQPNQRTQAESNVLSSAFQIKM